ncbi:hypothetical protein [Ornithinimicrobium avium]|uniref:HPr-rel-A system PqqD family protein n=1 Tax=Ornithinimicrobium avium TaxID=2283195 RepID=A0A345NPC2_9MICO|nr:hypothetical protein [Ornithinimicrobium avium]AXH96880.1 hypothetical protein DV701_12815 [Ornithinimicrobium avium]
MSGAGDAKEQTSTWQRDPAWGVADRPEEGDHGGRVYVAPLDTGIIHVLAGPAAVVCRGALAGHDVDAIREVAARELDVERDDVDPAAVRELLDELVSMGLLRRG